MYSLEQAREALVKLRPHIDEMLTLRANLAELRADLSAGRDSPYGKLADAKAWEAALFAELERFAETGAAVKGFAPLLLDYPGEHHGQTVLWCWAEGEPDIEWYHRADCGFAGRRRI